jgi:hypothetical protein
MTEPLRRPTLIVYRRAGCTLCDEVDDWLQAVLETRAAQGQPVPVVRRVDVDGDADLQSRYGALLPVLALDGAELPLVTNRRQVRTFLDHILPSLG